MNATVTTLQLDQRLPREWRERCPFCHGSGKRDPYRGAFSRSAGCPPERCVYCAGRGEIIHGCEVRPTRAA